MGNATLNEKYIDELNVRLSLACNTGAPFCFLGLALYNLPETIVSAVLLCLTGLAIYSFTEYSVHRWILHGLDVAGHEHHHRNPDAPHAMLFSTGLTMHTLLLIPLTSLFGFAIAIWTVLGSAFGYAFFIQLHDFEHRHPIFSYRLWSTLHRHHMLHHDGGTSSDASNDQDCNFGVLTTVWDRLLGTYRP